MLNIIIDTNVIFAGFYSNKGPAYKLLDLIGKTNKFKTHISVALALEYEDVLNRETELLQLLKDDIENFIDFYCKVSIKHKIYFLWRPQLKDVGDEHILELAIAGSVDYIVTYNTKNFKGSENFGIKIITPKQFLFILGEK